MNDDLISRISLKQSIAASAILKDKKTLEQIIDEETSADNDSLYKMLNEAHNEGYDVGYWAGRRDYEQKWIPVSERLPDLWDEKYLVSLAWGGVGTMEYKSTGFHNYGSFSPVPIETITAWMPLPKPYERKES